MFESQKQAEASGFNVCPKGAIDSRGCTFIKFYQPLQVPIGKTETEKRQLSKQADVYWENTYQKEFQCSYHDWSDNNFGGTCSGFGALPICPWSTCEKERDVNLAFVPRQSDGSLTTNYGKRLCCDMSLVMDGKTSIDEALLKHDVLNWGDTAVEENDKVMKEFVKESFQKELLYPIDEQWNYKNNKVADFNEMLKTKIFQLSCPWTKTLKGTRALRKIEYATEKENQNQNDFSKCYGIAKTKSTSKSKSASNSTTNECGEMSPKGTCSYPEWKRYVRDNTDHIVASEYPTSLVDASKYSLSKSISIDDLMLYPKQCISRSIPILSDAGSGAKSSLSASDAITKQKVKSEISDTREHDMIKQEQAFNHYSEIHTLDLIDGKFWVPLDFLIFLIFSHFLFTLSIIYIR